MSIMGFHKYLAFESSQKIKNEPNCFKHTLRYHMFPKKIKQLKMEVQKSC